jgi:acyl transferase domain-containing protein/phosphopantetheinyl transferase/acyl carrier protein
MSDRMRDTAIIGMACVFPKAPDLGAFWENILAGVDAIDDPPADWRADLVYDPASGDNDRLYTKKGGYLGDLARFDPLQFGVMPRSVDGGEPEHFLALRLAHDALADAGYAERPFNRARTGVILGRGTYANRGFVTVLQHTFAVDQTIRLLAQLHPEHTPQELAELKRRLKAALPPFNGETAPSLAHSVMCGRIANRLDLMGPAYSVDAACASTLIAVEAGMRDLASGGCDMVLAGGIQISTSYPISILFSQLGALSRGGQVRPFHPQADGTLLGEGAGIVVLKRLADAERDGDRIYAVIKAVGIASDGRAVGLLAPRVEGEETAMRRAYDACGIDPGSIGLLEAHGTGTPVGDATEIEAMGRIFGRRTDGPTTCAVGSVKSMIGHSIPAAGVAGLIKTALAMYHRVLPPTLHTAESDSRFAGGPLYLNSRTRPWIHGGGAPRRGAVSSFGFGGINAHAVLEEHGSADSGTLLHARRPSELVVVNGPTRAEVAARCGAIAASLRVNPEVTLAEAACALNGSGPGAGDARLAIVAADCDALERKLLYAADRLRDPSRTRIKERSGIYYFDEPLGRRGGVAFLFPGEGAQYPEMLADLCLHFRTVRAWFDLVDRAFRGHPRGFVPSQVLFPPPAGASPASGDERLFAIDSAIEAVFTANQALHALLTGFGIVPQAIAGHSTGEYSALLACGAVELGGEAELIDHMLQGNAVTEGALRDGLVPAGALLAVGPADPELLRSLAARDDGVTLAMDNCPHQVVLCGREEAIATLQEELRARGAICQRLPFSRAYHTPLFEPVTERLQAFYARGRFRAPQVPLYSCVTAARVPDDPDTVRRLAAAQWSRPVRFRETLEAMYADGARLFVEVGPRGNLAAFAEDTLKGRPHLAIPSNLPKRSGIDQLHHLLGLLAAHGVPLDLAPLYAGRTLRRLPLEALQEARPLPPRDRAVPLSLALPYLTLDDEALRAVRPAVAAATTPQPPAGAAVMPDAAAVAPPTAAPAAPTPPPVAAGRERVMQDYLKTMEEFLRTQEAVMAALLRRGDPTPAPPAAAIPPEAVAIPLRTAAVMTTTPAPMPASSAAVPASPPVVVAAPAAKPAPAVEAVPPGAATSAPSASVAAPARDEASVTRLLVGLISDKTGYPPEMIEPGLSLEADLGIDSIKRIEILGALARGSGLLPSERMEEASRRKTLRDLVQFICDAEKPAAATAPPGGAVATAPGGAPRRHPFAGAVAHQDGEREILIRRTLDPEEDRFLAWHCLGPKVSEDDPSLTPLPVAPLSFALEMMASAATRLAPGRPVAAFRAVRAARWIALAAGRLPIELRARRGAGTACDIEVTVREVAVDGTPEAGALLIEGTVTLGEPAPPPAAERFEPRQARPFGWDPERLYADGERHGMFHRGPFEGVASIDRAGEDGVIGTLRVMPEERLFASDAAPALLTRPLLIDALGQLLGFWAAERLPHASVVFPIGFDSLEFFGSPAERPRIVSGRARVTAVEEGQVRADLELIDAAGRCLARVAGWRVKRFDLPRGYYAFRLNPRTEPAGRAWSEPRRRLPAPDVYRCARVEYTAAFLEADGGICRDTLAHLVLGRGERETWRVLGGPESRRLQWLLGRIAAKDAVRLLLRERHGLIVYPADVEIVNDGQGRPVPRGRFADTLGFTPTLSLAHTRDVAVAIAGDAGPGVGIDVERLRRLDEGFEGAAFSAEERSVIAGVQGDGRPEWLLRTWCAKEAVAKAVGHGLDAGPRTFVIEEMEHDTGTLRLGHAGGAGAPRDGAGRARLEAYTGREGDLVFATALCDRG